MDHEIELGSIILVLLILFFFFEMMRLLPCLAVKSCGSFKYNPFRPLPHDFHHQPPFSIEAQLRLDLSLSLEFKNASKSGYINSKYCIYIFTTCINNTIKLTYGLKF